MRRILLPLLAIGIAGCMPDGGYYDGPPPRGGYYSAPAGYYPQSRWNDGGQCTFQTRHGTVAGYRPEGKNRCCVDTRNGPSCQ